MSWKEVEIGNLVELRQGLCINKKSNHLVAETGLPLLRITDMINNKHSVFIKEDVPEKYIAKYEDIIYSRTGQVGLVFRHQFGVLFNNCFTVSPISDELSRDYLYWFLRCDNTKKTANDYASGAAQLDLSHSAFKCIKIKYPTDKITQRRIASILSAYDDLIENNLKRIKLLEEKAFLRYKQIVREEKLEEKSILDICYVTDGTHDSPKQQVDGFYLVTGKHLIGGFIDFSSAYFISEADHDKIQKRSKVVNGDLVLSNIGTIGNVAIIDSPFEFSVKNVIIFKPSDSVYTSFLYCYLNSDEMQTRFQQESSGTSQRFISLAYARALKVKLPSEDVLEEFHKEVSSHLKLKSILNQQNTKLREARDILLTKLMNGQIGV